MSNHLKQWIWWYVLLYLITFDQICFCFYWKETKLKCVGQRGCIVRVRSSHKQESDRSMPNVSELAHIRELHENCQYLLREILENVRCWGTRKKDCLVFKNCGASKHLMKELINRRFILDYSWLQSFEIDMNSQWIIKCY